MMLRWSACAALLLLLLLQVPTVQGQYSSLSISDLLEDLNRVGSIDFLNGLHVDLLVTASVCEELEFFLDTFANLTQLNINVTCVREENIKKVMRNETGIQYDGLIVPTLLMQDLRDSITQIDDYINVDTAMDVQDIFPFANRYVHIQDDTFAMAMDGHIMLLFFRSDLMTNGPRTWPEYVGTTQMFNGMDLNGDGELDFGSCISMEHLSVIMNSIYAPMVQTRGSSQSIFLNSANTLNFDNNQYISALRILKSVVNERIPTIEQARALFKSGRCALFLDTPDFGTILFDNMTNYNVDFARCPGSYSVLISDDVMPCTVDSTSWRDDLQGNLTTLCPYSDLYINYAPFAPASTTVAGVISNEISNPLVTLAVYEVFSYISTTASNKLVADRNSFSPFRAKHLELQTNLYWYQYTDVDFTSRYLDLLAEQMPFPNVAYDLILPGAYDFTADYDDALTAYMMDRYSEGELIQEVRKSFSEHVIAPAQPPLFVSTDSSEDTGFQENTAIGAAIVVPVVVIAVVVLAICVITVILAAIAYKFYRDRSMDENRLLGNWAIDPSELEIKELIGVGSYGEVYRGIYRGTEVAVKMLKDTVQKEKLIDFLYEISVMHELRHPNVLLFMGASIDPPLLVTEYMPRGSLYDVLHDDNIVLDWLLIQTMALDAAQGMDFLHSASPPILHRDFKSLNLLVDKKWNLKVGDFGLTKLSDDNTGKDFDHRMGSVCWAAPEVLRGDPATEKSDIYSFGVVLWELLTRSNPYEGMNPMHVALAVLEDDLRPVIPVTWSDEIKDLLEACWHKNPSKRPTFKKVREAIEKMTMPCAIGANLPHFSSSFPNMRNDLATSYVEPPKGIITFVFTDIIDYDHLWDAVPEAMLKAITLHNYLIRGIMSDMGGYEVKMQNDSFMYAFANADSAASACLMLQEELMELPWDKKLLEKGSAREVRDKYGNIIFRGLRVRMGLNTGAAYTTTDLLTGKCDYFGNTVNRAAKVAAMAGKGEILLSENTVNRIEDVQSIGMNAKIVNTTYTIGKRRKPVYSLISDSLSGRKCLELKRGSIQWETNSNSDTPRSSRESTQSVQRWTIEYSEIHLGKRIGTGSFGEVYKGEWRGVKVAIKRFFRQQANSSLLQELRKESIIMSRLRHPNILLFLGACVNPPNLCIVTEYMSGGSVANLLHNKNIKLPWSHRFRMLKGIALGMNYLHNFKPPYIHRDLNTANLLIDKSYNVKIGDFGLSRIKESNATMTRCGTAAWTAPEILKGLDYSEKSDIYSFGIIMWEFLTRRVPFHQIDPVKISQLVTKGARPKIPQNARVSYVKLMTDCWQTDPDVRPTFDAIVHLLKEVEHTSRHGELSDIHLANHSSTEDLLDAAGDEIIQ